MATTGKKVFPPSWYAAQAARRKNGGASKSSGEGAPKAASKSSTRTVTRSGLSAMRKSKAKLLDGGQDFGSQTFKTRNVNSTVEGARRKGAQVLRANGFKQTAGTSFIDKNGTKAKLQYKNVGFNAPGVAKRQLGFIIANKKQQSIHNKAVRAESRGGYGRNYSGD